MPKDFDDISKKIDQSYKELSKHNALLIKDMSVLIKDSVKTDKEINDIKKQVKDISYKVDLILEILNNFTIMLAEEDEMDEENYDTDETWVPKEDNFWENDNDDESI